MCKTKHESIIGHASNAPHVPFQFFKNKISQSWLDTGLNALPCTDMNEMFENANAFNGDLSKWDVSSVTDMSGMFLLVEKFNDDISK